MEYAFKLHPDFDSHERLFGRPAVVLALDSEDPNFPSSPVTARVAGIANSLVEANGLVKADIERITAMSRLDPPRRPRLLPADYELHFWDGEQYCCIGHEIAIKWPSEYMLTGVALADGRLELTGKAIAKGKE